MYKYDNNEASQKNISNSSNLIGKAVNLAKKKES
jgi:hypothetical protein